MKNTLAFCLCLAFLIGCQRTADTGPATDTKPTRNAKEEAVAKSNPTPAANPTVADISESNPLIAHVVVALCDNKHQGIVPVPAQLGNGQDQDGNLYWGALYGVRTFMTRKAGWTLVEKIDRPCDGVLERIILKKRFTRNGKPVEVVLVADAWDGRAIRSTIGRFLQYSAGKRAETVIRSDTKLTINAGGASHFVGYLGHNGLMEFSLNDLDLSLAENVPQTAVVLACKSKPYFENKVQPLTGRTTVLTTSFMAPEAYTLDAMLQAWAQEKGAEAIRTSAASAYAKYQKCSIAAAKRMFSASTTP